MTCASDVAASFVCVCVCSRACVGKVLQLLVLSKGTRFFYLSFNSRKEKVYSTLPLLAPFHSLFHPPFSCSFALSLPPFTSFPSLAMYSSLPFHTSILCLILLDSFPLLSSFPSPSMHYRFPCIPCLIPPFPFLSLIPAILLYTLLMSPFPSIFLQFLILSLPHPCTTTTITTTRGSNV